MWSYLSEKAPEYADEVKRENELILMSDAFVQWRYCYEGNNAPAFDGQFLSAFANAAIRMMFELGYNAFFTERKIEVDSGKYCEIDKKFDNNRTKSMRRTQKKICKQVGGEDC